MNKPFIVAEMSANHNGSLDRALEIVKAAAEAGADAIKLQTWTPNSMCLDQEYTIHSGAWAGRKLFDLYHEAYTPFGWHQIIFDYARSQGLIPFSTPFDKASVDFLEADCKCPIYKVASFEIVDLKLIKYIATKGKQMFISTGMASISEIRLAAKAAKGVPVTFLKCTSQYPADAKGALYSMEEVPGWCEYGISDHTMGIGVAVAAAALGAAVIEKHLTLSRSDGGLDSSFSMEPDEFSQMVTECRRAAAAIQPSTSKPELVDLRRSLYFSQQLPEGALLTELDFVTARPAHGMHPHYLPELIGKRLKSAVQRHQPVTADLYD